MEVNNNYQNSDLVSQFLARQDMPKPATNPLLQTETKNEDTFVSSKDNSQPLEAAAVKSDDTFVKSEALEEMPQAENSVPAEEIKEEQEEAQEVNENVKAEEIKKENLDESVEEKSDESSNDQNVTKKVKIIDKIKGFFKNLIIKLKPKKKIDVQQQNCAGGGTN